MSIADKITSITNHLEKDYQALESVVGKVSVNKNIENIAPLLDNLWEDLPKTTGSGTNPSISDTRAGKMKLSLKGNTSQTGTPTPDNPQQVHIVSGNNTITTMGKNLYNDGKKTTTEIGGITISTNDNGAKLNGTYDKSNVINLWLSESANGTIDNAPLLKPNTNYAISIRLIDGTMSSTNFPCYISSTINNTFSWNYKTLTYSDGMWATTFTTGNEGTYISGVRFNLETNKEVTFTNAIIGIQLEESNSITSFEKHQESNYPINLPNGMWLGEISTYKDGFFKAVNGDDTYDNLDSATKETLDYGEWYLEKKIGKVVLDGSETDWRFNSNNNLFVHNITQYGKFVGANVIPDIKSNYYLANTFNLLYSGEKDYGISYGSSSADVITIRNKDIASVSNFETWLSTHNTEVYYVLATPTYTKIEGTLAEQLEDVWRAYSYKGQTNVTQSNNDLPFELSITALEG